MKNIEEIYKEFIIEAENFHVSKFVRSEKIDRTYKEALGVLFDRGSVRGVIAFHEKYGQGKTFFFDTIHSLVKRRANCNLFMKTSSKELIEIYKTSGEDELLKFIDVKNLFIDDIGAEIKEGSVTTKNYGNALNVIEFVIFKRYEMWQKKGWKLHGTTNISIDTIGQLYGGRVADRFVQMCEILEFNFTQTSFRQVKNIRPLTDFEKKRNLEKLYPKKSEAIEKVDMKLFLNELIEDSEEDIMKHNIYYWSFIRKYLERENLIIYPNITDADMNSAELLARQSIRKGTSAFYQNMDEIVQNRQRREAYSGLDYKSILSLAKNISCRSLILKMKSENLKF